MPAHLGTTDVDVLLVTQLTAGRDLGPIERALDAMEFSPEGDGWRWVGRVDSRLIKIEFLCDLDDQPAEAIVTPAGCSRLHAVNLRGTGNVEHDHREITLDGPDGPVRVRIAALVGYLLSKAAAARTRGADKDYNDLAYVLLHNHAGGPAAAAVAVNASRLQPALAGMSSTFVELRERFRNDRATGPRAFAQESAEGHSRGRSRSARRRCRRGPSASSSIRSGLDCCLLGANGDNASCDVWTESSYWRRRPCRRRIRRDRLASDRAGARGRERRRPR